MAPSRSQPSQLGDRRVVRHHARYARSTFATGRSRRHSHNERYLLQPGFSSVGGGESCGLARQALPSPIVGEVSLSFVTMGLWVGAGPTMGVYTAEFGSHPTMR
jgi:hypothetical protein